MKMARKKPTVTTRLSLNTTIRTPMGPLYLRFPLLQFVFDLFSSVTKKEEK
jgi:hypothetical protein